MKKNLFVAMMFVLIASMLMGVDEDVRKRFEKVTVLKGKDERISAEALKPDIERYQRKTDTVIASDHYKLDKTIIRSTNKELLNKWLKELK